ncbi:MFS transporter [Candidatus Kaiserbacteria bacterium]|nr:MFS transporter [Candidatus Kaiserbacteria bacterium]
MRPRVIISLSNFFFAFFSTAIILVMIPYLTQYMSDVRAGVVIAMGPLAACLLFPLMPRLVAKYGAQQLALVVSILEMLSLFALAGAPGAVTGSIFAALSLGIQPFLAYQLDLLLEATVEEEGVTGRVRTMFITGWNLAALAAPLLIGALLASTDAYYRVFIAAAGGIIPLIVLLAASKLPLGRPPVLSRMDDTLRRIFRDRDLAAVTVAHFILYLFFFWAPFYTPLYLHTVLGIPWSELGWMFAVMLVPYVLIEFPAGVIADKFIGDKEMMFAGFLIAGAALGAIGLLTAASPIWLIVAVLVATRIGAGLVESMTEGHFFRLVSEKDINSVSIFRGIWPLSELIAPLIGSAILIFGNNFGAFFAITGGIVAIGGAITTLFIRDFRPVRPVRA